MVKLKDILWVALLGGAMLSGSPRLSRPLAAELERSYQDSEARLVSAYGLDREQWKSFADNVEERHTTTGKAYVLMSSTVDFDMIQVCVWLPVKDDDRRLGVLLTQSHFQSLALQTLRVVRKDEGEEVSLGAANLERLGVNVAEVLRELCGAHVAFYLLDTGLRVKVYREPNSSGCFYIAQMGRDEVCQRLEEAGSRLMLKYDVPMLRMVSRIYLKKFLTYELSGHRLSRSHLRQTLADLYGSEAKPGMLRRSYPGRVAELEALRLLAMKTWLVRGAELDLTPSVKADLQGRLPAARLALKQVWDSIPIWWRAYLERALGRVDEADLGQPLPTQRKALK